MAMESLWGEEFVIEKTPQVSKKIIKKISEPKANKVVTQKAVKSKGIPFDEKLKLITSEVDRILGSYKEDTQVIRDYNDLVKYIDCAIENEVISIDTETNNSLTPLTCKLMGLCLYTLGQKNAYIPVNHIDIKTGEKLNNQITESQIKEQLSRLSNTKIIMHNGKFDYQVIKCTCGIELNIYWDTMIAVRILDENEQRAGLKEQFIKKINSSQEKYSIDHLFEGVLYEQLPPELFALYAATDSYMTYMLYEWQLKQFEKPGHERLLFVFMNIEMPVVQVAAEMELAGVEIDTEYAGRLSKKYHKQADAIDLEIDEELQKYEGVISKWRLTDGANHHEKNTKPNKDGVYTEKKSKSEQLQIPPQINSPTQLAILLYDVLSVPIQDKDKPRGTGVEILEKIDLPLCRLILEKRRLEKLISTYIDKLPACVYESDNRLHAHFEQLGAGTGRFSSKDPNLQNIPSKNKEIRLMFKPSEGNIFVGADFSQQEPRLLSEYSKDESMRQAYIDGKDLYATIAAKVYNNDYWDNMEHHEDGSDNPAGAKRRSNCKSLLLGIMYGRGAPSIAEQLKCSISEAQKIINDFYDSFPKVRDWVNKTEADAKVNGYVEDFWGRRRRLPDIQLPRYTVKSSAKSTDFNPLLYTKDKVSSTTNKLIESYTKRLLSSPGKKNYKEIEEEAKSKGISIVDNGWFISQAQRQCVNARVQGGAASMTKLAMRKIFDDQFLKDHSFKLVLQVHDEVIGECPIEYAEVVAERLSDVMKHAAEPVVTIPFKCDAEIESQWYHNSFKAWLKEKFNELVESGKTREQAKQILWQEHTELLEEQIDEFLDFN